MRNIKLYIKLYIKLIIVLFLLISCQQEKTKINKLLQKATNLRTMYPENKDSNLVALKCLSEAYLLDSNKIETNKHLASTYSYFKNYQKTLYHLRKVLKLDHANAETMVAMGINFERAGNIDSAIVFYKAAKETFIKRPQSEELKKIIDLCDAGYVIILIENDTAKAIKFIESYEMKTNNKDALWLFGESRKMIEGVDRKTYIEKFE